MTGKSIPIDTSFTHIRPRFEFTVPFSEVEVLERLKRIKEKSADELTGHLIDHHLILDIPVNDRHYWSPQLSMRVEADEDDPSKTVIKGLIGPRPSVWTMFTFFYFTIGVAGFFIASWGFSKWMLGEFSHLIWALPIAMIINLTAYRAGKQGEKLGHDQVEVLKGFVREVLDL
ncbi:hypothetical protein [Sanyastnella coralliicola]|uniref:hypothetical protein n=1 Tax=Sanyastnella coralliicola TaxID=3069118 RepID=UPI0027BA5774|nr:hypothetical protein [Longitalea sp. SCSIO 12813]